MISAAKARQIFSALGCVGFVLCLWLAYQCAVNARDSASRGYALSLSEGASDRTQTAARENGFWMLGLGTTIFGAILCLSMCWYSRRTTVLKKGIGAMLLVVAFLPATCAWDILFLPFRLRGKGGPSTQMTSWSSGGITFEWWQLDVAGGLFALTALSLFTIGLYLLLGRRTVTDSAESGGDVSAIET